jgi:hypothetical protein
LADKAQKADLLLCNQMVFRAGTGLRAGWELFK